MRLIVDTHAALWLLDDDDRLSRRAARLLTDSTNEILLSAAVVWEVAIKRSLGKLEAPEGFTKLMLEGGTTPLAVSLDHADAIATLPWHHRDPFDRLLIAQAIIDDATIVSADERLHAYSVPVLW